MSEKPVYTVAQSAEIPGIKAHCPHCGYGPLDGATCTTMQSTDEARNNLAGIIDPPVVTPKAGDISICWKCKALLVYATVNGKLTVRAMNRRELKKLKSQSEKWDKENE